MNAKDNADLDEEVFLNHGCTSLHFYKPVSIKTAYQSYLKMHGPHKNGMYSGDMIIFEGDEVVAAFKGVKAQGVPRRLMDYIVHTRDDTKTGPPRNAAKQASDQLTTVVQTGAATVQINVAPENTVKSFWSEALAIIAEESGVPVSELTSETAFADLGVDSLLSLLCASRFREELGLDYESSTFAEYLNVREMEVLWNKGLTSTGLSDNNNIDAILNSMFRDNEEAAAPDDWPKSDSADSYEFVSDASTKTSGSESPKPLLSVKVSSTSLLLQGNPAAPTTTETLFLLPDGAGSASSYGSLPRVHQSVALVGLNCPYVKIPEQFNVGIETVTEMYIHKIRRRQPGGPYNFGGWSVGGIFAYHVAQQLAAQGETVRNLLLIDYPVPRGLDHLPKRYYEYCDKIGLLGKVNGGKRKDPPQWLIPHF